MAARIGSFFHVDGVSLRVHNWSFGNDDTFGSRTFGIDQHRAHPDRRCHHAQPRLNPVADEFNVLPREHARREVHPAARMHQQREVHALPRVHRQLVVSDDVRVRDGPDARHERRTPHLIELPAAAARFERRLAHHLVHYVKTGVVVVHEEREQAVVGSRQLAEPDGERAVGKRGVGRFARRPP